MLGKFEREAAKVGMKTNVNKTVLMKTGKTLTQEKLLLNQREIKEVNEFCYLGSIISMEGRTEEDIKQRIWKAQGAFGTLKNIATYYAKHQVTYL